MNKLIEQEAIAICDQAFDKLGLQWSLEMLREPNRGAEVVYLRRIAAQALRAAGFSFPQIGKFMQRNHATIMHLVSTTGYHDSPQTKEHLNQLNRYARLRMIEYHQRQIEKLQKAV